MLYNKFVKINARSMLQYKLNTFFLIFSSTLYTLIDFASVFILFSQFKSVGNWGFYESSLMFGMITAIYATVECFARGYDEFSILIRQGDLDRMLVRPVNIYKQIFCSKTEFIKVTRIAIGVVVCAISLSKLHVAWTFAKVVVLLLSFVCGTLVIFGVILVDAGLCIFTVERMELANVITNGSKELCYYPIDIYNKWLRRVFTFIIPLACFNYLPLSYIMGFGSLPRVIYALSPLIGCVFVVPCFLFFRWSLKHYQSTGT